MKKFLCLCIVMLIAISSLFGVSAKEENKTFKINNEAQLVSFLNGKFSGQYDNFILCRDIILTEKTGKCEFSGLLDGKGFSIVLENGSTGLFSKINKGSLIRNLSLSGNIGKGEGRINGICEENNGTVENCIITAYFFGTSKLNGICSVNNGEIINCANLGEPKFAEGGAVVWHPAASVNNGKIERFYYIKDYVETFKNDGTALDIEQCKNGELTDMLNAYANNNQSLVIWGGTVGTYPEFITASKGTASVFANNQPILVACFIVVIVMLLVFTIIYTDKRFKKAKSK